MISVRAVSGGQVLRLEQTGPGSLTGGVGGWEQVARSRRTAAVEWVGTPGYVYQVPVLIGDGSRSVEPEIGLLQSWGLPRSGGRVPSAVKLDGELPFGRGLSWVVADLAWDEGSLLLRDVSARRVQAPVTVTFWQFVEATVVRGPASKSKAGR